MICVLILLCIQIITESLPISSSLHVYYAQRILKSYTCLISPNILAQLPLLLDIVHIPMVLIVGFFAWYTWSAVSVFTIEHHMTFLNYLGYIICADSITCVIYLLLRNNSFSISPLVGLGITTVLLASLVMVPPRTVALSYCFACILGCVQGVALLPGISRFAATYVVGCWLGLSSRAAFIVSWMFMTPLMMLAISKAVYLLYRQNSMGNFFSLSLLGILALATVVSGLLYMICWELACTGRFWLFSLYTGAFFIGAGVYEFFI